MVEENAPDQPALAAIRSWPILARGFRPFYLMAGLFSLIAIAAWAGQSLGYFAISGGARPIVAGPIWHAHEMMFGFVAAVIAGFLLTAVQNWTGRPTPTGLALLGLSAVWLVGRVLMLMGPRGIAAAIDIAFLPLLAGCLAIPIWRTRNVRNVKILAVLAALTCANGWFHAARLGLAPGDQLREAVGLSMDLVVILMAIVGGRVIPAFTTNAIPGAQPRRWLAVDILAMGSVILLPILRIASVWWAVPEPLWMIVLAVATVSHGVRWLLWGPQNTLSNALLLMLPVAYLWIPVSMALRLMSHLDAWPIAAADHALTVGAMTGLMMAMMMRSSLGHTGRPLRAGWAEVSAFVLMQAAALTRVAAVFASAQYATLIALSGALWVMGMGVFLAVYGPYLLRPRVDGKAG